MTLRSVRIYPDVIRKELKQSRSARQALQPLAARATRAARQVGRERLTRRTGRYDRSFKSHISVGHGNEVARVVTANDAPYAGFIEKGTRPHVMPRKATVYVFQADDGTTVFTHGPINHPGTEPQRVIEVALKRVARGQVL